jgi:hypothetical protein
MPGSLQAVTARYVEDGCLNGSRSAIFPCNHRHLRHGFLLALQLFLEGLDLPLVLGTELFQLLPLFQVSTGISVAS